MSAGLTTVSSEAITDATGTLLESGIAYFQPCSSAGVATSFRVNGSGQALMLPVAVPVVDGAFSVVLADTTLTNPINIGYIVTILDATGRSVLGPGYFIQPHGGTWSFDTFVPNLAPSVAVTQGPVGATGPATTLAIGSVTGGGTASATLTGAAPNQTLSLVLPVGATGPAGAVGGAFATSAPLIASGAGSVGSLSTSAHGDHQHPTEVTGLPIAPASVTTGGQAVESSISTLNPLQASRAFCDSAGNAWLWVDMNGVAHFPLGVSINNPTFSGDLAAPGLIVNDVTLQNGVIKGILPHVINDSAGNIALQVNLDGSVFVPLGLKGKFLSKSAMDSDGFIYYSALDGLAGSWQLYKVDPSTAYTWKLTTEGNNYSPALSQDGNKLIFITDRYGTEQAAITGLWGGTVVPCTESLAALYNWNFLGTIGQSLAIGYATNAETLTQPYTNLTFSTGPRAGVSGNVAIPSANMTSSIPLVEVNNEDYLGAANDGETMSSGAANRMASDMLAQGLFSTFFAAVSGKGNTAYNAMAKGSVCYLNMLAQVTAAQVLAVAAGKTFGVVGMMCSEGGADETNGTGNFDQCLRQWWATYNTDIAAITGQLTKFPLLFNQDSGWGTAATGVIAFAQLKAHETYPGDLILTNPMYNIPFSSGTGHMTSDGYRQQGEYMGKVLERVMLGQKGWRPTSPRFIQRVGNQIIITFHVPVGPLVIDTTTITPPTYFTGGLNGFEYFDASGAPPTITATTVIAPNKVLITLSSAPTVGVGAGFIRYAYTAQAGQPNIPSATTGPRGCLRDSDASASVYGYSMYNWCVHFNKAC